MSCEFPYDDCRDLDFTVRPNKHNFDEHQFAGPTTYFSWKFSHRVIKYGLILFFLFGIWYSSDLRWSSIFVMKKYIVQWKEAEYDVGNFDTYEKMIHHILPLSIGHNFSVEQFSIGRVVQKLFLVCKLCESPCIRCRHMQKISPL